MNSAFYDCSSLTSISIGTNVTSIGVEAFSGCNSLTSIVIPNGVTNIWDFTFQGCYSLTSITIGTNVTSIGVEAFQGCYHLTDVTIPNGVTYIGNQAFADCDSLTSVTIPDSVNSIGIGAFAECNSLTAITVDAGNSFYSSINGVLFDKSQTTLLQCPGGLGGNYTIPDGVTSIGGAAFHACTSLISVTVPNSVTDIGANAFSSCESLSSVYFQGNAPSVGQFVFAQSANVTVYYYAGTTGWPKTSPKAYFAGAPLVSVYPPPTITFQPRGATLNLSDSTSLSVAASGPGPLTYQWFDNGVPIVNATNQTLTLTSIQFTNAGLYLVVVSSPYGSVTNTPAEVVVISLGMYLGMYPSVTNPGVTISGVVGYTYVIQSKPDLTQTNGWTRVATITLTNPVQLWVDSNVNAASPTNAHRFYQVLPGP
jgi:hypothetical protein